MSSTFLSIESISFGFFLSRGNFCARAQGPDLQGVTKMRIVCEMCGKIGYLQHIGKNYYRVRHYERLDPKSKKPVFTYHQQSLDYIKSIIDQTGQTNIDPKRLNLDSNLVRRVGFEPTNPYGIAASGLRLWPCLATPAQALDLPYS